MLVRFDTSGAQLILEGVGKIRVSFEMRPAGSGLDAVFECLSCTDLLGWSDSRGRWACPTCGFELSPVEAHQVLRYMKHLLGLLATDVQAKGGGGQWRWGTWLRRLLRLKEA